MKRESAFGQLSRSCFRASVKAIWKEENMSESSNDDPHGSPEPPLAPAEKIRSPTPQNCRNFIRRKTADAMPDIVEAFVKEAKGGSVRHFASLAKVGGIDQKPAPPPPQRRGKSLARRLLDEVERFEAKHGIQPGQSSPDTGERTPEESI